MQATKAEAAVATERVEGEARCMRDGHCMYVDVAYGDAATKASLSTLFSCFAPTGLPSNDRLGSQIKDRSAANPIPHRCRPFCHEPLRPSPAQREPHAHTRLIGAERLHVPDAQSVPASLPNATPLRPGSCRRYVCGVASKTKPQLVADFTSPFLPIGLSRAFFFSKHIMYTHTDAANSTLPLCVSAPTLYTANTCLSPCKRMKKRKRERECVCDTMAAIQVP